MLSLLENCNFCPHNCNVNRVEGVKGFCNLDSSFNIASVTLHRGEEPAINGENGVCNVFFSHCNMQCVYCQNIQISSNRSFIYNNLLSLEEVVGKIIRILKDNGTNRVGFVSPAHNVPQVIEIISALKKKRNDLIFIYNTNAYEKATTIQLVAKYIDVFLPDLKYFYDDLARKYSKVNSYFDYASKAIKIMLELKGKKPVFDDKGYMLSGVIIRHLILPGHIDNTEKILEYIVKAYGKEVFVSIMAQYYPYVKTSFNNLNRKLTEEEYNIVWDKILELGFENGWFQELESATHYLPDFTKENPFESD